MTKDKRDGQKSNNRVGRKGFGFSFDDRASIGLGCTFVFVRLLLTNENGGMSVDHTHDEDGVLRNANSYTTTQRKKAKYFLTNNNI